jgi:hypothetical protein
MVLGSNGYGVRKGKQGQERGRGFRGIQADMRVQVLAFVFVRMYAAVICGCVYVCSYSRVQMEY